MPVCRAIRRLHILQVQLMTASSRLSGDPSCLGNTNHLGLQQKLGEIRGTQAIKELTKQGLGLQVQRTQGVTILAHQRGRSDQCDKAAKGQFTNPATPQSETHRHWPTQEESLPTMTGAGHGTRFTEWKNATAIHDNCTPGKPVSSSPTPVCHPVASSLALAR